MLRPILVNGAGGIVSKDYDILIPGLVPLLGGFYIISGTQSTADLVHNEPGVRHSVYLTPSTRYNAERVADEYFLEYVIDLLLELQSQYKHVCRNCKRRLMGGD